MSTQIKGYIRSFELNEQGLWLRSDTQEIFLKPDLDSLHTITAHPDYACCFCMKKVKKLFSQAYCFNCSQQLARCDLCMVRPERCHYAEGTCREPSWGEQHCFIPHVVYLAWTSDIKIGVTRKHRMFTRWREQGALAASVLYETPHRLEAGQIEVALKNAYKDRTHWQKMLNTDCIDLEKFETIFSQARSHLFEFNQQKGAEYIPHQLTYPLLERGCTRSLNSPKLYHIQDALIGIKGTYLLFKTGAISVRSWLGRNIDYSLAPENPALL